jgi:hypothetical protein
MDDKKRYWCEYVEKGVFTVEDIFYSMKNYEFISLYLWYNDKFKNDLYLNSWRWVETKTKTIDWKEVEMRYGSVYVETASGEIVEKMENWWANAVKELINKYYTDWD